MLRIHPRKDLPDRPEVICRVSGGGESRGSAHVVPSRARGDDLPPFFGFVPEALPECSPLIVGDRGAPPAGVPVGAGKWIRLARRPAVQDGEAETNVIGVRGDRRFSVHGPLRLRASFDRFELANQATIPPIESIRLLTLRPP